MRNLLIILSIICWGSAYADDAREHQRERVDYIMGDDRIVAGERELVSGAVAGDLIVAGSEVIVVDPVGGDLLAAGGEVRIDADTGKDLYSAGGRVALNGAVKRNARLAGGKLEIGRQASIAGNATLAGGDVIVLGDVHGHLAVAGGRIYLSGRVDGNVAASGGEIELGPETRIGGNLSYRSTAAIKRDPGAEVRGTIVREPDHRPWREQAKAGLHIVGTLLLMWTLGLMIVGAVFVTALPVFTARMADTARSRLGLSLLLGFAVLIAVPAGAVLLMATGIGFPLGLLLLTAYLATLMLGYVSTGIVLGQRGLRRLNPAQADRTAWRAAATSLAILILTLLAAIPLLGWLVGLTVMLSGMGMLLLQLRSSAQAPLI